MNQPARSALRRHRWHAVPLALAVLLLPSACSNAVEDPSERSTEVPPATAPLDRVTWVIEGEPSSLDPIYDYAYYDNTVIANMCEPLVRMNPDLSTSDWLATSTMVDPTTWTYDLREGITFWDGSPLTPADVVYSLKRNLDPAKGSYFSSFYTRVEDIRETGPMQVTVTLSQPDALWNTSTSLTAGNYIVSKKFAEAQGEKFGSSSAGVMCTGPYKFGQWVPGDSITLEKNENYWNQDAAAKTDTVEFVFLEDTSAQANALTSGEAQGMYVRDQSIIPRLRSSEGNVYYGDGLTYQFIIPTAKSGPLADVKIRQALSLALDREAIAERIYEGAAAPIKTLVGQDAWGPDPDVRAVYQEAEESIPDPVVDLEAAKELVAEAGSPTTPIILAYPTQGGEYQLKLASVIQDAGAQIGLNIELKPLSPSEAAQLYQDPAGLVAADIDLISVFFNVNNADPFGMYQIFDPGAKSVYNYSHFEDDRATEALAKAAGTYDDVKRAELTVEAQSIIMESLPIIPLVSTNAVVYLGEGVTGAPATFAQIWSAWAALVGRP